jgi:hypothetical protein
LGKKYGKSVLARDSKGKLVTGNVISEKNGFYIIRYGEESSMPFSIVNSENKSLTFNWDKDIQKTEIRIDDCIVFMGRKNGISDIA